MKINLKKGIFSGEWKDIEECENRYQISNLGQIKSLNYRGKGVQSIIKNNKTLKGYCQFQYKENGVRKVLLIHRLVAKYFLSNINDKPEVDHIDTNPSNNRVWNLRWVTKEENMNNNLTKKHLSEALRGENNPKYEKQLSEETRRKMSESRSGEKHWNYGKTIPIEVKNKISKTLMGHPSPRKGVVLGEDTRNKISESLKGKMMGSNNPHAKAIYCYELDEIRLTANEWVLELNVNASKITRCCKGNPKQYSTKGYHFRYATEEEIEEYKIKHNIDK